MIRRYIADTPLIGVALLLSAFGVAMVYSAGQTDVPTVATHAWRSQMVWIGLGLTGAFIVSRASVRFIEWVTVPVYVLSIVLLIVFPDRIHRVLMVQFAASALVMLA